MAIRRQKVSEQDIAAVVVAWLEAKGADVYQEVEVAGGVADIVAKLKAEVWIVEVKTSPSLALLVQAFERRELAHRIFVAAPPTRNRREFGAVCGELGIGVLDVHVGSECVDAGAGFGNSSVREVVAARCLSKKPVPLSKLLKPEHKTHGKAGAIGGGGRWTAFRATCEQLARVVLEEPGISLQAAVAKIEHHYRTAASARNSLRHWIERGRVEGVALASEGHVTCLRPIAGKR